MSPPYSWPRLPHLASALHNPTYLASWMRAMTSQRPTSPHTLAAPISMNTSTHSSTLSHVSSFCWDSDCKNPRPRGQGQPQSQPSPWVEDKAQTSPLPSLRSNTNSATNRLVTRDGFLHLSETAPSSEMGTLTLGWLWSSHTKRVTCGTWAGHRYSFLSPCLRPPRLASSSPQATFSAVPSEGSRH